jgi:hypothetical protein
MSDHVFVSDCELGKGLFAARAFRRGETILRVRGPVLVLEEVLAKGERQSDPVQIGERLYLDTQAPAVYSNHSCDPNAGLTADLELVALRPLAAGDEIRWDYSTSMSEDLWTMPCRCGSAGCRGVVGDFQTLPGNRRRWYLKRGVVQEFIARRQRRRVGAPRCARFPAQRAVVRAGGRRTVREAELLRG